MAKGTRRAFSVCVFVVSFSLLMATMEAAPPARAQTLEGTVRLTPSISTAPLEEGPFQIFLVLEDLEHYGAIVYDDNDDTVPDRQVASTGMGAFEFTIEFDETVVAIEEAEPGPDLGRAGRSFQCLPPTEEPGTFSFGCVSTGPEPTGLQGSLTLASLTLRPLGRGSSPLALRAGVAGPLGDDVPVADIGGAVRVTGGPAATAGPGATATRALSTRAPASATARPLSTAVGLTPATGTPVTPTASVAAGGRQTPEITGTPADGDGRIPNDVTVPGKDPSVEPDGPAATGGGSAPGVAVWLAVALGSLAAAGALVAAAVLWRRGRREPGA